ncbi:MAG TPA: hypothetical protein VMT86_00300 [Bryobacteraceae bacterium]|nr:hypothetical protein [Bryobacteraceae bacterium]
MPKTFSLHYKKCGWQVVLVAMTALPVLLNGAETVRLKGTVKRGKSFRYKVSDGLIFGLDPTTENDPCQGWVIWMGPSEQMKNYAGIATGPLHGLRATDICGSDFRNSDNSGPNAAGPKNVNRSQKMRQFRFVANQSDYQVLYKAYGTSQHGHVHSGKLNITRLSLGNLRVGSRPTIERMEFTVALDLRSRS